MTLTSGLLGQVITPDHDGYDTARQVWNGAVDRRPAFIVRCCHAQQVATAVLFAGHHGLPLAVRGGGHSIPGLSVCDGGLVIDLAPMKTITVAGDRVHVGAGVLWRDLIRRWSHAAWECPVGRSRTPGLPG